MSHKRKALKAWVKTMHTGQRKKYSGESYHHHLIRVAKMAEHAVLLGFEIGLCHDLLEDTGLSQAMFFETLVNFGYDDAQANFIVATVNELTDKYPAHLFPGMDRKNRKKAEAKRLCTISASAQTVKYCDLIDNMPLVSIYELEKAKRYFKKKLTLLNKMNTGDTALRNKALEIVATYFNTHTIENSDSL